MLEFVDDHGNEVLNLGSFATLPQHVVRLIMARFGRPISVKLVSALIGYVD